MVLRVRLRAVHSVAAHLSTAKLSDGCMSVEIDSKLFLPIPDASKPSINV